MTVEVISVIWWSGMETGGGIHGVVTQEEDSGKSACLMGLSLSRFLCW